MSMAMRNGPQLGRPFSPLPSQIISAITSLLQTLNPHHPDSPNPDPSILNQFDPYLNPSFVIQVINSQTNPYHALFFFNWASNPKPNPNRYSHSHFCYIAITDALLSRNLFSVASNLLESSHRLSDFMVGKFIKAHGDLGHVRWALNLFRQVKVRESGRCLFSYNAILGVFVRASRMDLARGIFDEMVSEGVVQPDVSTYTVMIRGFCKMGMIEDALKLFDKMPCRPNSLTYNTIISGLCKKGMMEIACEIVDRMVENGGDCLPNTVTYTTLIDGYCKRKEMDEAKKCFDLMVSRNCVPNELTYNALINGFCLCGEIDEAKHMMTRMRLNGLKDNIATNTSLLKGYCIAGRSDEAFRHFKDMASLGMKPDAKCYEVLINENCKMQKPDEAVDLLKEMRTRGIQTRIFGFNAAFRAFVNLGEVDRAILLLKQMPQMGCKPNFLSYNPIICGLVRVGGRMREVEGLVNDMLGDGLDLDSTLYSCLVEGHSKDGNENKAIEVFEEMVQKGYVMNLESFAIFVKGLVSCGKVFEAKKVFQQLVGVRPLIDVDRYRRVLDECLCR